jgi:hypothetical protein
MSKMRKFVALAAIVVLAGCTPAQVYQYQRAHSTWTVHVKSPAPVGARTTTTLHEKSPAPPDARPTTTVHTKETGPSRTTTP